VVPVRKLGRIDWFSVSGPQGGNALVAIDGFMIA
jgi:hypothetical protein